MIQYTTQHIYQGDKEMKLSDYIITKLSTIEERDLFISAAYEEYMRDHDIAALMKAVEYVEKAEEFHDN